MYGAVGGVGGGAAGDPESRRGVRATGSAVPARAAGVHGQGCRSGSGGDRVAVCRAGRTGGSGGGQCGPGEGHHLSAEPGESEAGSKRRAAGVRDLHFRVERGAQGDDDHAWERRAAVCGDGGAV